jgi:hypothetical protein
MIGRKMPTHGSADATAYTRPMVQYSSRSLVNKTTVAYQAALILVIID